MQISMASICYRGQRYADVESRYFGHLHAIDERIPRLCLLPHAKLVAVRSLYSAHERKHSLVYCKELPRLNGLNGPNARLHLPDGAAMTWQLADPVGGSEWAPDRIAMIKRLMPHVLHVAGCSGMRGGWKQRSLEFFGAANRFALVALSFDRKSYPYEPHRPAPLNQGSGFCRACTTNWPCSNPVLGVVRARQNQPSAPPAAQHYSDTCGNKSLLNDRVRSGRIRLVERTSAVLGISASLSPPERHSLGGGSALLSAVRRAGHWA